MEATEREKPIAELTSKELGYLGECLACRYLENTIGLKIVERNWICSAGEADIVAIDDKQHIHLIEVKTRYTTKETSAIYPEEAVSQAKQRRYRNIALMYISAHALETQVYFSVLALNVYGQHNAHVHYIPHAYVWDE